MPSVMSVSSATFNDDQALALMTAEGDALQAVIEVADSVYGDWEAVRSTVGGFEARTLAPASAG
jgi:hypothetical protein